MFNFLHLELTSRCQKDCPMCGRRKMEREHPELCDWGDMPMEMVYTIAEQVPAGTVVQLHNNGEPLMYHSLGMALMAFPHCIKQLNTNGILLVEKAEALGELDVLTISVIDSDPAQAKEVQTFEAIKGDRPRMIYRLLGDVNLRPWMDMPGQVVTRTLHLPEGSRCYQKPVTIPEHGVCLDLLTHLAIDRHGDISICVRFDPNKELRIGNIDEMTLQEAWNSDKRQEYIKAHVQGKRDSLPGCGNLCTFYGIPVG